MKTNFFLCLIILIIFVNCNQEKESSFEGGWILVYANAGDLTFPGSITGAGEKSWTKGTFTFAGHYIIDTTNYDNYGWGTYNIDGNKYEEHILYHHLSEATIGKTIKMILEVKNDTLYQKWPLDDNWQLPEKYSIEKYVRLK